MNNEEFTMNSANKAFAGRKPCLVAVVGPTGSGKTALSIELAKRLGGEIISCDSMQIYRGMDIGTAKPTIDERQGIPHHMIDILEPHENFSVSDFCDRAKACIFDVIERKKLPILVGGTGLYIDSLVGNVTFTTQDIDEKQRESLHKIATEKGNLYLHNILAERDPIAAGKIHPNNVRRVVRALEMLYSTGITKSEQDKLSKPPESPYKTVFFSLDMPRDELYERINKRVDIMVDAGLVDEVRQLVEAGLSSDTTAMQAIGYKEIVDYINGNCTLEIAIEKIKQESRRYAKRQLTWFSKNERINRIALQECYRNVKFVTQFVENVLHN